MKLGVLNVLLADKTLDEALAYLHGLGVEAVELGSGGYTNDVHCKPAELLASKTALQKFKDTIAKHEMFISALSPHGNPVHPIKEVREKFRKDFNDTVLLAEKLGVDRIITFSGCPGDSLDATAPNWVTSAWPDDFPKLLEWQWNEVLIPYWQEAGKFAKDHGVKVAFEMHPGFCVYNPETCLKLRAAVGDVLGANLDPSHLFWQGIDPVQAILELKDALYFFHAKDTKLNEQNIAKNGVLDTKHFSKEAQRSWIFRTVGYGHGEETWRNIMSALRLIGYDYVLSIEHEDSLMTPTEGLEKAVSFLQKVMIHEPKPTGMWWA